LEEKKKKRKNKINQYVKNECEFTLMQTTILIDLAYSILICKGDIESVKNIADRAIGLTIGFFEII
jgi:hypothetical protein